ncbi:MAG: SPOR domain-containing protein [Bacteroidota bacterium]|nr:SPOR domain-containing protein [Bacteroidota bacterium]
MKSMIIHLASIILIAPDVSPPDASASVFLSTTSEENRSEETNRREQLQVRPFPLDITPPSSGVQFYKDGIIFLSHSKIEEKVPAGHVSFGALKTYSTRITDSVPGDYTPFNIKGSVIFPSEAATFTSDYNTMYVSLIPERAKSEKIFRADYTPSGWIISDEPINICTDNSIYSHPCLSADGTFMVFSSDMVGSMGGLDLFITRKEGETWSEPKNLGKHINSSGNELFASFDSWNNLCFSSDGHPGEGGYDIFISAFDGEKWGKPQNLTDAINTKDDEMAFTICRDDNRTAFYTTRTRTGKSRSQLKLVTCPEEEQNIGQQCLAMVFGSGSTPSKQVLITQSSQDDHYQASIPDNAKTTQEPEFRPVSDTRAANTAIPAAAPDANKETAPSEKIPSATPAQEHKEEKQSPDTPAQADMVQEAKNDVVVYRVQILSNTKPAGARNITVAGKTFKSFEYLYKGAYRTTIGEFSNRAEASRLQSICRQNDYSQAFVVAFKNNVRSDDPSLFR